MVSLTKVLPIKLKLVDNGKGKMVKKPLVSMAYKDNPNFKTWKPGMKDFAIHLSDYPDIIVLDLDIKDHRLKFYKDHTYTHETRKGWHCFFLNTYNITNKRQKAKDKFDLLAGDNWVYYNYNDPTVATYIEYNQLPLAPMPAELFDLVKETIEPTTYTKDSGAFIINPVIDQLRKKEALYEPKTGIWGRGWDSSDLAYALTKEALYYTDIPAHNVAILSSILDETPNCMDSKHIEREDLVKSRIKRGKAEIRRDVHMNWRPLSDFRLITIGGKTKILDIDTRTIIQPSLITDFFIPKWIDTTILTRFVPNYPRSEFMPNTNELFVGNTYNLFHGFVEPTKGDEHTQYLQYVHDTICSGDSTWSEYLVNYMAHMVQFPAQLPDVAIVLRSQDKGNGKDTLHKLLGRMFKKGGYVSLTKEVLTGRFNAPLGSCLLGVAEELSFGGSHAEDNAMKTLITRPQHPIEHKGSNGIDYVNNYIRLFITSNYERPVKATKGERRYFVLSPSNNRIGDEMFWNDLNLSFEKGQAANNLLYYLLHKDISNYSTRKVPDTPFLRELIIDNIDPIDDLLLEWWAEAENGTRFTSKGLFNELEINDKYLTPNKLMRKLKALVGKEFLHNGYNKDLHNHLIIVGKEDPIKPSEPKVNPRKVEL